jgi:hypothetical protein
MEADDHARERRLVLQQDVIHWIDSRPDVGHSSSDDGDFLELAHRILLHQWKASPFLARYLTARSWSPTQPVHTLTDLPAVSTAAFRGAPIQDWPKGGPVFHTSGTTGSQTGIHAMADTQIYDKAASRTFGHFVLGIDSRTGPSPVSGHDTWQFVSLLPPPSLAPHSSLVHMMALVARKFSATPPLWLAEPGPRLTHASLQRWKECLLSASTPSSQPWLVAGPAFAFVQLLELHGWREDDPDKEPRWPLPPGSRIMETGGFKGRTREIERTEFHALLSRVFQVPLECVINEYGMTELTSQFYDRTLLDGHNTEWKSSSPWLRAWPVDPLTGRPCKPGHVGLLRVADLGNLDSAVIVQTEDQAIAREDSAFRLLGRVLQAPFRGCSLPFEQG